MKKFLKIFSILSIIAIAIIYQSCKKDSPVAVGGGGSGSTPSIKVLVLNEVGTPISGAEVKCGSVSVVSNSNGSAVLNHVTTTSNKYNISVKKDGFFKGYKNVAKTSGGGALNTEIKLIEKQFIGTTNANMPADLPGNQFRIVLNGQGFVDTSGNAVSGNVSVFARYISAENMAILTDLMPGGDFAATSQSSTNGILESYGFTAIEFIDPSGNRVFPNAGGAQVAIQLPANVLTQINAQGASVWYFNESTSNWGGDQSITPTGSEIYMPVTSSTFGNCDRMNSKATFKAKFFCGNQTTPIAGKKVTLTGQSGYAMIYTGFSNDNGNVLIEVGIPSSGGSYEMNIDGYTATVNFTANQITDLGSIDVCNLQGQDGSPRFNLKWASAVDLDLYVRTPSGDTISYSNPSAAGGQLDIDCICSCADPTENIFWDPAGPAGVYTYWVEYYDACSGVVPASYTVTLRNNGSSVSVKTGVLSSIGAQTQHWTFTKL